METTLTLTPLALSIRDFTRLTSISRSLAYVMIRDGRLKSTKIAGRTVIAYAEAERLIREAA
jgi:hypothetical protein